MITIIPGESLKDIRPKLKWLK